MRGILGKKGDGTGISFGAIFAIVLGLAVIFIIILSVNGAFTGFWDKITGRTGSSNSPEIISACKLACQNEDTGDYCSNPRTLKFGEEKDVNLREDPDTVAKLQKAFDEAPVGDAKTAAKKALEDYKALTAENKKLKQVTDTCNGFANNYDSLGEVTVAKCSTPLCVSA